MTLSPLILTARLDETSFRYFDDLRKIHFPPARNRIAAHLTLFHALPGEKRIALEHALEEICREMPTLSFIAGGWMPLGAGTACRIECRALQKMHRVLQKAFSEWLTPQDRQGLRPHVTVQNKVSPAIAEATRNALAADFVDFSGIILGLDLWHYQGGTWAHAAFHRFNGNEG